MATIAKKVDTMAITNKRFKLMVGAESMVRLS